MKKDFRWEGDVRKSSQREYTPRAGECQEENPRMPVDSRGPGLAGYGGVHLLNINLSIGGYFVWRGDRCDAVKPVSLVRTMRLLRADGPPPARARACVCAMN